MKARNVNTLSRRRTRRPDGGTYRDLRKRSGSGRRGKGNLWLAIGLAVAVIGVAWLYFR